MTTARETTSDDTRPLGDDARFFEPAHEGALLDQRPATDDTGADVREYTGEPVETDDGWVIPMQQNVGPGNEAGQGEFPDRGTGPTQPKVHEDHAVLQTAAEEAKEGR